MLAVDAAYPLVGRMETEPPIAGSPAAALGADGLLAEGTLLARLRLAPGDVVQLGGADFTIRGRLIAQPDQGGFGFALGPRVVIAQAGLARAGLDAPGTISRHMTRALLAPGVSPTATVAALEAAWPAESWRARAALTAAPTHARPPGGTQPRHRPLDAPTQQRGRGRGTRGGRGCSPKEPRPNMCGDRPPVLWKIDLDSKS